jgi:hypothetical protein
MNGVWQNRQVYRQPRVSSTGPTNRRPDGNDGKASSVLRRRRGAQRDPVRVAQRQAGHRRQRDPVAQRRDQREDRGLALADGGEVPAGVEDVLRLGGGVHPARDVQHPGGGGRRDQRPDLAELGRHGLGVGRVERPQDRDPLGPRGGDLGRALRRGGPEPHLALRARRLKGGHQGVHPVGQGFAVPHHDADISHRTRLWCLAGRSAKDRAASGD